MTKQDFIFSNQRRHRMARHVAYWIVWLLFYVLLFHYPVHSFKGWSISQSSGSLEKIGVSAFIVKTVVFNSLLSVVVPQAVFIYVLLYWLLPGYFYQKRNPAITASVTIGVLLFFLFAFASFRVLTSMGNYIFGTSETLTDDFTYRIASFSALRGMLTSLPVVTGFALMIKIMKRWWVKQKEAAQLAREKANAELQLLKAQVHPHFLFNTLNNIYFFTLSGSPKAPEMVNKLSGLLHYILNECNQSLVPLQKEINMIRDYIDLEKVRYGEQMKLRIEIEDDSTEKLIAPLLLIPFVENSFKHGASRIIGEAWVKLRMTIENNTLQFFITNSRPQEPELPLKKGNIGLKNVKQRLQLLYPGAHELKIVSEPESFAVHLKIQLQTASISSVKNEELITPEEYAMA